MTQADAQLFVTKLVEAFVEAITDYQSSQAALISAQTSVEEANKRLTALTTIKNSALQLPEVQEAAATLKAQWP